MSALNYFKSRLEATVSPMDVQKMLTECPEKICIIDVRNGPAQLLKTKIKGALLMPQMTLEQHYDQLPKDKELILYCWETWCSLAVKAAVPLLEKGFKVKELYGGMAAWNTLHLPVEPVADSSSGGTTHAKCSC